jgi:ABC-type enterobactin transport system permease subunit
LINKLRKKMKTKMFTSLRSGIVMAGVVAMLLAMSNWSPATGQVVIGSATQSANAGAILDLSKMGEGQNTTLGLLLSSIALHSTDMNLVTLGSDSAAGADEKNVEGMLVYCPGGASNLAKGLYVWDGSQWKGVILAD